MKRRGFLASMASALVSAFGFLRARKGTTAEVERRQRPLVEVGNGAKTEAPSQLSLEAFAGIVLDNLKIPEGSKLVSKPAQQRDVLTLMNLRKVPNGRAVPRLPNDWTIYANKNPRITQEEAEAKVTRFVDDWVVDELQVSLRCVSEVVSPENLTPDEARRVAESLNAKIPDKPCVFAPAVLIDGSVGAKCVRVDRPNASIRIVHFYHWGDFENSASKLDYLLGWGSRGKAGDLSEVPSELGRSLRNAGPMVDVDVLLGDLPDLFANYPGLKAIENRRTER